MPHRRRSGLGSRPLTRAGGAEDGRQEGWVGSRLGAAWYGRHLFEDDLLRNVLSGVHGGRRGHGERASPLRLLRGGRGLTSGAGAGPSAPSRGPGERRGGWPKRARLLPRPARDSGLGPVSTPCPLSRGAGLRTTALGGRSSRR